ncbi:hypothetical protein BH23GEM6_BH23GEM6_04560 [soil metagenome]
MSGAPDQPEAQRPRRRLESRGRLRKSRRRAFYSIGEVCDMLGIKPHVLRYWETQFPLLSPSKNRAGNRVYTGKELDQIALIRRLVHDERYTIEGARLRLRELEEEGTSAEQSSRALETSFLRSLGEELEEIAALLEPGR